MTRCTVSGNEPTNDDRASVPNSEKKADGQHVDHWVMCPTEIMQEGFKRPIRTSYQHVGLAGPKYPTRDLTDEEKHRFNTSDDMDEDYAKFETYPEGSVAAGRYWTQKELNNIGKGCGTVTSMPRQIAETYAANPHYYGSTFCCGCGNYFPVGKFGEFVWTDTDERVGT